jgi:V8-like Glu-specific endopeptidase
VRVTLEPPQAKGRWRFEWETVWRQSGSTVTNLVPGNYPVVLSETAGWLALSPRVTNAVSAGVIESVTNSYVQVGPAGYGALSVTVGPQTVATNQNEPQRGQWRVQASPANPWQDSGTVVSNLAVGGYVVEFKDVTGGYGTPAARVVQVISNSTSLVNATYLLVGSAPGEGPRPLAGLAAIQNTNAPYQFNGQVVSEAGYGSGFVVRERTVLTAAHVVYDPATLNYASEVWWFFQRQKGEFEAVAQQPRGWYVFGGYAAARTNDIGSGNVGPGESSAATRALDVAALYFFEDAGRGGYGGYLTTISNGVDWLSSAALKMLVGYPMAGVPDADRGRMHLVGPGYYLFDAVSGYASLYRSTDLKSYPGNSGGPLYVQSTDSLGRPFFLPGGIYLGDDDETVVRVIDVDVVDLINRAEASSRGGGNSTGGGVITIIPGQAGSGSFAILRVDLGPTAAVQAGAGWRRQGENEYSSDPNSVRLVPAGQPVTLEFAALPGWNAPVSWSQAEISGEVVVEANYTVVPPVMVVDGATGIGLVGTTGTTYRIEQMDVGAGSATWVPINTNTLVPGTNVLITLPRETPNAALYRAVWIPEP